MRLRKLVKFVFRNKGLETFPGYLHILESVIDISRGQLYPMFIDAKFARSGFQKIRQGGEVEGTTEQRCRHGLEVDKRPPMAGRLDASPACSAACPLFCLKCKLDQRGASIEVSELYPRFPRVTRQLKREAAFHGLAPFRPMSNGKARQIERVGMQR